jgi:hypothetical protein
VSYTRIIAEAGESQTSTGRQLDRCRTCRATVSIVDVIGAAHTQASISTASRLGAGMRLAGERGRSTRSGCPTVVVRTLTGVSTLWLAKKAAQLAALMLRKMTDEA